MAEPCPFQDVRCIVVVVVGGGEEEGGGFVTQRVTCAPKMCSGSPTTPWLMEKKWLYDVLRSEGVRKIHAASTSATQGARNQCGKVHTVR